MIIRIVRMHFKPESVSEFLAVFEASKDAIRAFNGCESLRLLQDVDDDCSIQTLSFWKSEEHLNAYRASALFQETWAKTKVLFDQRPQAASFNILHASS
ncbi:MAG: putative quinol monooxygenase [Bacteroidia bacterium]